MLALSVMINSAPTHPGSAIMLPKIPREELGWNLPGQVWPPEQACPNVAGGWGMPLMGGRGWAKQGLCDRTAGHNVIAGVCVEIDTL